VPAGTLTPELLASLLADGDDELAAWTLQHALAEQPRAVVFDGLLAEAMELVGERWETGQWSVAEEHLASQTLLRALERIRPDLGPEGRVGPLAVLAAVAGEYHMIGLVCLGQVLADEGWTVANLGADVPAEDLALFVRKNAPALVALTAAHPDRADAAAATAAALREASDGRHLPIMLGGRLGRHPGIAATLGVDQAVDSIAAAVRFARSVRPAD
jgi:methanogenic corrinoid protein MtbC1